MRLHVVPASDALVTSLQRQGYLTLAQGKLGLAKSELVELRSATHIAMGKVVLANAELAILELVSQDSPTTAQ